MQVIIIYIHCLCFMSFIAFFFSLFPPHFLLFHLFIWTMLTLVSFPLYIPPLTPTSHCHVLFKLSWNLKTVSSAQLAQEFLGFSSCPVCCRKWPWCSLSWPLKVKATKFKMKGKCGRCYGGISPELILLMFLFYFF